MIGRSGQKAVLGEEEAEWYAELLAVLLGRVVSKDTVIRVRGSIGLAELIVRAQVIRPSGRGADEGTAGLQDLLEGGSGGRQSSSRMNELVDDVQLVTGEDLIAQPSRQGRGGHFFALLLEVGCM